MKNTNSTMKNTNSTMKDTNSLSVKEFISLLIFLLGVFIFGYLIISNITIEVIEDLLENVFLFIFFFIVGFPIAILADDFRELFVFIPDWIVKILRIVGIAEFGGLVGLIIWFVFVY